MGRSAQPKYMRAVVPSADITEISTSTTIVNEGIAAGTTAQIVTASLAGAAQETGIVTIAKAFLLYRVDVAGSKKFRLRLYETSAARDADASRTFTVPLQLGAQHGCILDLYIDQSQAATPWKCTPVVLGANNDTTQSSSIYYTVDNIAISTQAISLTLTFVPLES